MEREFVVPPALAGERVDRAVALLTGWSRADAQALVDRGELVVDGRPVTKSHRLEAGVRVRIMREPDGPEPPDADPAVPVTVRYADDDVIVVDKAAGLVVHPGAGHRGGTLVNGLLALFPELAGVGDPQRPGIVHRLDRDTSGLLVVARSPLAYELLVAQLAGRRVDRRYDVLCWGRPASAGGVIDAPLGRSQVRRTRMAVREGGRAARTHYDVAAHWRRPGVTRLDVRLETGRTHQIRVHLMAIGHPVVGDATYGGFRQSLPLARPFLHAGRLAFAHPRSGAPLAIDAALPDDLSAVLTSLGGADSASRSR